MKMFNYLLLMTLMVGGSVLCEEEDINTSAMMILLSRRLDRTDLDLVSLERRMQSQFEELKTMIGNIGSAKQDESIKEEIESHLKPLIESSIRTQALTVYSTLTAEKKALRQMKKNLETQVTKVASKTENDIGTLQNYLKDSLENVDRKFTVTETNDKTLQTDLENTAREIAGINDACKSNFNTALSSTSSLQNKVSNLETELLDMKSKINKNANSVSSITSDMSVHTSFSTRLLTQHSKLPKATKIVFNDIVLNHGNNYDANTGEFTAPVSGVYLFLFNVATFVDARAHVELKVNGLFKADATAYAGKDHYDQTGGNSAIVHVSKGEKVWIETASYSTHYAIWPYRTSFHGALLHT